MTALKIFLMLLTFNLPLWVYAWFYIHTHNLVAAAAYFVALVGLSVGFSHLIGWLNKSRPDQSFGCLIVVGFAPGIFLAIFQVVPMLQMWLTPPALGIPIAQVQSHREAGFYSFTDAILAGKLQHWRREKYSRRSGGSTTYRTKHFQVMPVVGPTWQASEPPIVWLTSEEEEEPAFAFEVKQVDELSGLVLVKPDDGFLTAVEEACKSADLPIPQAPILLTRTENYPSRRAAQQKSFLLWLGLYNLVGMILVGLGARSMGPGSKAATPDHSTKPEVGVE